MMASAFFGSFQKSEAVERVSSSLIFSMRESTSKKPPQGLGTALYIFKLIAGHMCAKINEFRV
jgi:hypothetical protein